jgi:hypothetical protein
MRREITSMIHEPKLAQTLENLGYAEDSINDIIRHKQLLDIALEHSKTFNESNFNRITVLLENYMSTIECEAEHLQFLIDEINKAAIDDKIIN